jgi:hypothetical protein
MASFISSSVQGESINNNDIGLDSGSFNETTPTYKIKFNLPLKEILRIAGITLPPTGSMPKTGSIEFGEVKGKVVNALNNEPIKGVKVSNSFLKTDTTNEKGEFTIEHPDLLDTLLPPSKFPIYFKKFLEKPRFKDYKLLPYSSTGDIQLNVGIIAMNPKESNLKKEIIEFFRFPKVEEDKYKTINVSFEYDLQKNLNDLIDEIKKLIIPLILGMIEAYAVSESKELLEKFKKNPQEALNSIRDQLQCPTPEERKKIIDQKNKLLKALTNIQNALTAALQTLVPVKGIIDATDIAFKIIKLLPLPTAVPPGIGLPASVLNGFADLMDFLKKLIAYSKHIVNTTLGILILLEGFLAIVIGLLQLLDYLMQICAANEIEDEINGDAPSSLINQEINNIENILNNNGVDTGGVGTGGGGYNGGNNVALIQSINNIQGIINTIQNPNPLIALNQNLALNTLNILTNQINSNQSLTDISSTLNTLQSQTNLISISSTPILISQTNQVNQFAIANQLTDLTNQNPNPISSINGFTMAVEPENTPSPIKRRRAIAKNKQGIIMLTGEWSYSSIDQILIDELVFYIQQKDLKAD